MYMYIYTHIYILYNVWFCLTVYMKLEKESWRNLQFYIH